MPADTEGLVGRLDAVVVGRISCLTATAESAEGQVDVRLSALLTRVSRAKTGAKSDVVAVPYAGFTGGWRDRVGRIPRRC